jgi:hypothetical protein
VTCEFQRLIGRAFADKTFRDELLTDPQATLKSAGFNLSRQESEKLVVDMNSLQGNAAALKLNQAFGGDILAW